MANEFYYSTHGDAFAAAIINQLVFDLMADKVDLRMSVIMADDPAGKGSATVSVKNRQFDEIMAAVGEGSDVTNSALAVGKADVTVARQALSYIKSDLATLIGTHTKYDEMAIGIYESAVRRASALITALFPSFTEQVLSAATDMDLDDHLDAQFALQDKDVPDGEIYEVLHPVQWGHLQAAIVAHTGMLVYEPAFRELANIKYMGYKGHLLGTAIFTSQQVTDDSTDYIGAMYAKGAIAMSEIDVGKVPPGEMGRSQFLDVAVPDSKVWVEFDRSAKGGESEIVGNYYAGAAINEDDRGVEIKNGM